MRDRAEHMEHQFTDGRARVDLLFQAEQRNAALLQHGNGREQLGERAAEPVEAYDREGVAAPRVVEQRREPWPFHRAA